jgi:hypothetical protein
MIYMSEQQSHESYAVYQNGVPAKEQTRTYVEWIRFAKVRFTDVPLEESVLVFGKSG